MEKSNFLIDLDASKFDSARRLKVTPELTVVGEQVKTFFYYNLF
jgi:hypothetical protein